MNKTIKNKLLISIIINIFLFISSLFAMILYLIPNQRFYMGVEAFKYYTNLSNIFLGISGLIYIILYIKLSKTENIKLSKIATLIKFFAVVPTTITLVTVLVFLGPQCGFGPMFGNPQNILFHAINPVLGIISFLFFDKKERIEFKHTLYGLIFTAGYSIFYGFNLFINNDDFYLFYKNGIGGLILVIFIMFIAVFGLNNLYKFISNKFSKN